VAVSLRVEQPLPVYTCLVIISHHLEIALPRRLRAGESRPGHGGSEEPTRKTNSCEVTESKRSVGRALPGAAEFKKTK
jgi:hypothetical protein